MVPCESECSQDWFEAKVKLAASSRSRAIGQTDGRFYTVSRSLGVIVWGCLSG